MFDPFVVRLVSGDLRVSAKRVRSILEVLSAGYPIPFIAQYRKDLVGDLGETFLRRLAERYEHFSSLVQLQQDAVARLEQGGRLTPELKERIQRSNRKEEIEEVMRVAESEAMDAKDEGAASGIARLVMLMQLQRNPRRDIDALAAKLSGPGKSFESTEEAIERAVSALAQQVARDRSHRQFVSTIFAQEGRLVVKVVEGREAEAGRYKRFFNYSEQLGSIPYEHLLMIRRGETEGLLETRLEIDEAKALAHIRSKLIHTTDPAIVELLERVVQDAFTNKIAPRIRERLLRDTFERAENEVLATAARFLRAELMRPVATGMRIMGIEPAKGNVYKAAVIDGDGYLLETTTFFLRRSEKRKNVVREQLVSLMQRHGVAAVCVGISHAARDILRSIREAIRSIPGARIMCVCLNRAGLRAYAGSSAAREEFPNLDVGTRCAVSLGRRFQDPLYELLKIDPKHLDLGPAASFAPPDLLRKRIDEVVEASVGAVGIDVNRAHPDLLSRVSGLSEETALAIVQYRKRHGKFKRLEELAMVPGINPRVFERAAGFLKIEDGECPLDKTAIHPRQYPLVEEMARDHGIAVSDLLGNSEVIRKIEWSRYNTDKNDAHVTKFIRQELKRAGRDPRGNINPEKYQDYVDSIDSLKAGMVLYGTVTNVTDFGAFVSLGIPEDGMVHVSQVARRFVQSPHQAVRTGDRVKVMVLKVDKKKKRISLSIKRAAGKKVTLLEKVETAVLPAANLQAGKVSPGTGLSTTPSAGDGQARRIGSDIAPGNSDSPAPTDSPRTRQMGGEIQDHSTPPAEELAPEPATGRESLKRPTSRSAGEGETADKLPGSDPSTPGAGPVGEEQQASRPAQHPEDGSAVSPGEMTGQDMESQGQDEAPADIESAHGHPGT